jgi:chitinase
LLEQHDLDGIDVDWEFPVGPPDWELDIKTRPQDKANFISLLKELRAAMDTLGEKTGKRYGLSAAANPMPWYFQRNDIKQAIQILDTLKIMAYDYYGSWSSTTGHNANLYTSPNDPAWGGISTNWCIEQYLKAGFPASKLMVGVAFYGHAWQGVKTAGSRNGLFQPYDKKQPSPFDGAGWDKIKPLLETGSGYTRSWDDVAKSPYVYNGDTFISYTDQEALGYIVDYAKAKGLGGVFAWEYAHDMDGELLKVLFEKSQ